VELTASAKPLLPRKMDASESDMSGLKRLSDLCSKQSDEALKIHASHATKLADTSERTHTHCTKCTGMVGVGHKVSD